MPRCQRCNANTEIGRLCGPCMTVERQQRTRRRIESWVSAPPPVGTRVTSQCSNCGRVGMITSDRGLCPQCHRLAANTVTYNSYVGEPLFSMLRDAIGEHRPACVEMHYELWRVIREHPGTGADWCSVSPPQLCGVAVNSVAAAEHGVIWLLGSARSVLFRFTGIIQPRHVQWGGTVDTGLCAAIQSLCAEFSPTRARVPHDLWPHFVNLSYAEDLLSLNTRSFFGVSAELTNSRDIVLFRNEIELVRVIGIQLPPGMTSTGRRDLFFTMTGRESMGIFSRPTRVPLEVSRGGLTRERPPLTPPEPVPTPPVPTSPELSFWGHVVAVDEMRFWGIGGTGVAFASRDGDPVEVALRASHVFEDVCKLFDGEWRVRGNNTLTFTVIGKRITRIDVMNLTPDPVWLPYLVRACINYLPNATGIISRADCISILSQASNEQSTRMLQTYRAAGENFNSLRFIDIESETLLEIVGFPATRTWIDASFSLIMHRTSDGVTHFECSSCDAEVYIPEFHLCFEHKTIHCNSCWTAHRSVQHLYSYATAPATEGPSGRRIRTRS